MTKRSHDSPAEGSAVASSGGAPEAALKLTRRTLRDELAFLLDSTVDLPSDAYDRDTLLMRLEAATSSRVEAARGRNACGHLVAEVEGSETRHCAGCEREARLVEAARVEERERIIETCEKRRLGALEVGTDHGKSIATEMCWTIARIRALAGGPKPLPEDATERIKVLRDEWGEPATVPDGPKPPQPEGGEA